MTDRRAKITLGWRPGTPARRIDDFVEVPVEPARTPEKRLLPELREERRSIGRRLENWGMWANARGGSGPDCMTGAICDSMRLHAGEVESSQAAGHRIDARDAERVNTAFVKLPEDHRKVLSWTYVFGLKPWGVAGACGFPTREYDQRLAEAQAAIEAIVGGPSRC